MPAPGKYPPPGFIPAGTLPMPAPGYAPLPVHPHLAYGPRPVSQMVRDNFSADKMGRGIEVVLCSLRYEYIVNAISRCAK